MNWDEEKEIYIHKLDRVIDGINKINTLEADRLISEEMKQELDKLNSEAKKFFEKLKKDEFSIAVVGLEKSGKSSFANALIGLNVLPTDDGRCTYTSTCIMPGDDESAIVKFYSKDEFNRDFHEKLTELEIPNTNKYISPSHLPLKEYEELYKETPEEKKQKYEENLNQDIRDILENWDELKKYVGHASRSFHGDELKSKEFSSFITDPARAVAVKEVIIYSTKLKDMPNAILYDVPGFDSPTAMHREQTLEKMGEADAIIMVAAADKPSLTSTALGIFKDSGKDGRPLNKKLFVFANKADAVTSVENLNKNMETTRREWIEKRKLLPRDLEHRIIFGSARAHLGQEVDGGAEAAATLEKYGINSGILDFRKKLDTYYKNDRFEVLKEYIDAILYGVKNVFADTKVDLGALSSHNASPESALLLGMYNNLRKELRPALQRFKQKINTDANKEKQLGKDISIRIDKLISTEKYNCSQELIDKINLEIDNISGTEQPQKLDGRLREEKFYEMYRDFTNEITTCVVERHNSVSSEIVSIFMNVMGVKKSNQEYAPLSDDVANFCSLNKHEDISYYHSLIERFAHDAFEVQIMMKHGTDRFNKFQEEYTNFSSLNVFYNQSMKECQAENNLRRYDDNRYLRLILYPEEVTQSENAIESIFDKVRKISGLDKLGPVIEDILVKIVRYRPYMVACAEIESALKSIKKDVFRQEGSLLVLMKDALSPLLNAEKGAILDKKRYLEHRGKKENTSSYEQVAQEFEEDVLTLRDGLLKAFVPAINLDKAFSAKESTLIDNIVQKIDEKDFEHFLLRNLWRIAPDAMDDIERENFLKEQDRAVMLEIREILKAITAESSAVE